MPNLRFLATCLILFSSTTLLACAMPFEECDSDNHDGMILAKYDHNGDFCINVLDLDMMGYYYVPDGIVSTFSEEAWRYDLDGDGVFTMDDIADQVAHTTDNAYELPVGHESENLVLTFGDANGSLKVTFVATPANAIPAHANRLISDLSIVKRNYLREVNGEHKWTSGDFDFDGFVSVQDFNLVIQNITNEYECPVIAGPLVDDEVGTVLSGYNGNGPTFLIGDMDIDGNIDSDDLDLLCQHVATRGYELRGDLDLDQGVDEFDSYLMRLQLGLFVVQHPVTQENGVREILPGDANVDGFVNALDQMILIDHLLMDDATWSEGDFDCNGAVDLADVALLLEYMSQDSFSTPADFSPSY